jgi:FdhD protein
MDEVESVKIERITSSSRETVDDVIIREIPLTIILNNEELVTLLCSPRNLDFLAVGFLSSEGLLKDREDIKKIVVDEQKGVVRLETVENKNLPTETVFKRVLTSGCGRGASFYSFSDLQQQVKIESDLKISPQQVFILLKEFHSRSEVYRETGGVHSAALCNQDEIMIFHSDIGRHNAVDKVLGECVMNEINLRDRIVITSGRTSSEILIKAAKKNIPVLISSSAPTSIAVHLANQAGLTLIGFARGQRMNVYSNGWRVT